MEAVNGDAIFRVMGDTTKKSLGVAKSHFRPCPALGPELDGNDIGNMQGEMVSRWKRVCPWAKETVPMDTNRYMTCQI